MKRIMMKGSHAWANKTVIGGAFNHATYVLQLRPISISTVSFMCISTVYMYNII